MLLSSFIGHFHPVFVHLPIGILLMGLTVQWLSRKDRYASLRPSVSLILLIGAVTAIISCITGYLLAEDAEYEKTMLDRHKWLGLTTAIASSIAYAFSTVQSEDRLRKNIPGYLGASVFVLVMLTGHLGGSLTHGAGYLIQHAPLPVKKLFGASAGIAEMRSIPDVQEARAYEDIVAEVIRQKCSSCHGTEKQKGGLRLDKPEFLLKGGKNGKVLALNDPYASEIYKRIMLPSNDEFHMPPAEKPQLSSAEMALLHWWISNGHDFGKKIKELPQTDSVRQMLKTFQTASRQNNASTSKLPLADVTKAPEKVIDSLRKIGVLVMPIEPGRNHLQVNFVNCTMSADSATALLTQLSDQLVWLRLSGTKLTDKGLRNLAGCKNLKRLFLDHTDITDAGVLQLNGLKNLEFLNLTATAVSSSGLKKLDGLDNLTSLHVFDTGVRASELPSLQTIFTKANIDTGGYSLPMLESDTSILKPKQ